MKTQELVFTSAQNIQHDVYGECRMEVWLVYKSPELGKIREPEYVIKYYKNGWPIDEPY